VKKKILTLFFVCVLFAGNMYPSGFQINENGARAMAMAGAFTGLADDPSAIYFNPAGITQLDGIQIYAGATMIMPISSFSLPPQYSIPKTNMDSQVFFPINFYITYHITSDLSVGLGINNQFGLGTKWPQDWVGSQLAVETSVKTFFFTPVVAYKISPKLSISAGATIATNNVLISRMGAAPDPRLPNYLITLDSKTATAVGFTLAFLYKPDDRIQIGACYRSKSKFNLTGTATSNPASFPFQVAPGTYAQIPYPNGDISASLTTPPDFTFGISIKPIDKWTITADYQWIGWSTYDSLKVNFNSYKNPLNGAAVSISVPKQYQDSYILRVGTEYKVDDILSLRAGIYYDHNPIPEGYVDPTLPDADRTGICVGAGYNFTNNLRVDLAYQLILFPDRTTSYFVPGTTNTYFNGTYSNIAHLIGLNLSYNL
jgi:long-chain fatty acid transport protein